MAYDREAVRLRVKDGIAETGMSLTEFARRSGIRYDTLRSWRDGRGGLTLANAVRLCDALGWELDRLACRGRYR